MQPKHRLSKQDAVANDGVPTKSPQISPGGNLDEALAIALSLFEKGDAVSRRRGAAWTVISLLEYKRKHQVVPWSRLNPAYELVVSLGDLDLGKDDPMFAPLRGGKPKASTRRELLQETAAAAVTILMEGGCVRKTQTSWWPITSPRSVCKEIAGLTDRATAAASQKLPWEIGATA